MLKRRLWDEAEYVEMWQAGWHAGEEGERAGERIGWFVVVAGDGCGRWFG